MSQVAAVTDTTPSMPRSLVEELGVHEVSSRRRLLYPGRSGLALAACPANVNSGW